MRAASGAEECAAALVSRTASHARPGVRQALTAIASRASQNAQPTFGYQLSSPIELD